LGETVKSLPEANGEANAKPRYAPQQPHNPFTTSENEAFLKMMEDPMVYIK